MVFDVVTIFPDFFKGPFDFGVIRRGRERGLIETRVHDLREFASNPHRTVDDRPFGGGEGMVFKPEPIFKAVETARKDDRSEVVVLSAAGRRFNQAEALRLSKAEQVILVCGRYEGIDERVIEHLATAEISVGDFILSGGEIAAALVIDAVTRYVPGVVGKEESILRDSFSDPGALAQLVEHPHYTRPAEFRGWRVPEVLISGDHGAVRKWRCEAARQKTQKNRPDLLAFEFEDENHEQTS
ncbi:MAG TPA: tRNA (guanosine(37)-N1)-methyltransferase TrmD [Pyrinomonadaceae bacterium]|jgi:tRNA (guanine37-N1)-methyltransferase|nr:tRNA (guanosine(37)-N1)-methyltransferase TrmD [Pyrinomonadaceae bacterium]